ncbi:uncharacterized protein LOC109407876 [Aedes albopictus]|uniref:ZAD domain-containing protein n=1 Tax=Aedes albopictus TaxID=7160 RepID=A0ABM2A2M2_AEDAL
MDSGSSHRARKSRTAEVCRLCLKKRYLVDIDGNQYLCMQLKECFPHLSPDDSELPRFVCGECYQLVEITYQFIIRTRRTEVLLRSYVHMGGDFPNEGTLEAEYRSKRSASPEKDNQEVKPASKKRRSSEESSKNRRSSEESSKKRRSSEESSNSKKDNERNSSKHRDDSKRESTKHKEKDSSRHKQTSNRSSSSSKRKEKEGYSKQDSMLPTKAMTEAELKRYYNSDEYLFGGADKTQNDRVEEIQPPKDAAIRMESVASHLKGISLEMSYEEMANVLAALQTIESSKKVSM